MTTTSSGLQYEDTVVGTGATPQTGQTCVMHYTGWLYKDGQQGAKFDSSRDRNDPFEFPLGAGMVIKGWDEGVQGMQIGGQRFLEHGGINVVVVNFQPYLLFWMMGAREASRSPC